MTSRQRTGRLFRKYALVVAGLVGGALLVSGLIELAFIYQESSTALSLVQREKATTAAARIAQFMTETEHQISWTIRPAGATREQRSDDYLRLLRLAPAVTDVSYVDAAGLERLRISRVSLNAVDTSVDRSTDRSFVEARGGHTYFSPIYYRTESEPYMTIALPESSPNGGVTIADVNLKFMWDVITPIKSGQQGYAYVVDQTGQLIAHRDISRVLRRSDYSGLPQVQLARTSAADAALSTATIGVNPDGAQVLAAYELIEPPGWWVFVEQPLGEAFAPLVASLLRTALLVVAGLVLSIVATLTLARRMLRPIQALAAGAASIGSGALEQRIDVHTGDELESLAEAFNQMAAQLASSRADLEDKVALRTQELVEALHELEIASQHKSEFLASMSHELRTPLNAVIGFSDMVLHEMVGPLNDKQREYLGDVLSSGRHLLALINDMLDLAKIEAGKMSLERGAFSLRDVVELTVGMISESAQRRHLELLVHVAPDVGQMTGDERKVKQVLINLLANAVKFTPDGGRITVEARRFSENVEVTVRDTGIGLSEDDQLRIFEAFQQGSSTRNPLLANAQGTGLGLTLARKFVELHGGRIWVDSAPGHGSAFTFTLPVHAARARAARPAESPHVVGTGPTMLLVEDDPHAVELLSVYLREAGFSYVVTDDAAEGLRLARELRPIAVSLDILLPGSELDGWDLLAQLKSTPQTADIPVIVVSIVDERGKGFALGAADYLVKPLRRDDLLAALGRVGLVASSRRESTSVLLIEHDEAAAQMMAATLRSVGYAVSRADSARSGVEAATNAPPSLVIVDLLLPDSDGITVAESLRARPALGSTPILIVTAQALDAADKARLRDGVEVLAHGSEFDGESFLSTVRRLQPALVA